MDTRKLLDRYFIKNPVPAKRISRIIECRRLDSFDVSGRSLLLKIDVEAQELQVLQGASIWFEQRRCAAIYLDGFDRRDEVLAFLKNHEFEFRDGRTLESITNETHSLLALRSEWLAGIQSS